MPRSKEGSMKKPSPKPTSETEKAVILSAIYQYLGGRLESVARRASITMVLLGSFLGYASTTVIKNEGIGLQAKILYTLEHPSILLGLAGMFFLLWCETAKVKRADDFISRLVFTDNSVDRLATFYRASTGAEIFSEMLKNIRLVGQLLRKKVLFYNIGSVLFVISITVYVAGL